MASSPPFKRPVHRVSAASTRVGASKAQAALAKIIDIISTVTAPPAETEAPRHGCDRETARGTLPPAREHGFGVDLRLRLGPSSEVGGGSAEGDGPTEQSDVVDDSAPADPGRDGEKEASVAVAPAELVVARGVLSVAGCGGGALTAAKSSEGECDPDEENGGESDEDTAADGTKEAASAPQKETKGTEGADGEITATIVITTTTTSSRSGRRSEGCLDLLLEAVRQVSGGLFDDDGPEAKKAMPAAAGEEMAPASSRRTRRTTGDGGGVKKRRETDEWTIPFHVYQEDTAPIVRSKRGRSQALPSRYRDSILDPWQKSPALTRHSTGRRGHDSAPAATR
ncbi:hypothetical protein C4D60_Mb06t17660 [Musa balbisiana]|uniref:Uncharacterized protein n=1 Tax=Musa balbisiana TaxID=52838 RepID=A0A4S8INR0_MUSBA|nr:hypothetical protein C4D60_Mb06t17660 [Musa balbisiana]